MVNPEEMLADDVEMRRRHQVMDVGHPPRNRILDRDHREMRRTGGDRGKCVLESAARQRLVIRERLRTGDVRIGPPLPLESNLQRFRHAQTFSLAQIAPAANGAAKWSRGLIKIAAVFRKN